MLLVTRCTGESLVIGESVTITVVEVRNSRVRLCVEAPGDVTIHREEVYDRIMHGRSGGRSHGTALEDGESPEENNGD